MNILFVTPAAPEKSPFFTTEKRPPLGLGFLISLLRAHGHGVHFIDNYLRPEPFIEDGLLQRNSIEAVGVYTNTICFRDCLRIFHALEGLRKKGAWKGLILAGGPHASLLPDSIPGFVDHLVIGEGEQAILRIAQGARSDKLIRGERIEDLDQLPFQPWDIFASLPYDRTCEWLDVAPVFTLNTSRGCPFDCAFCSVRSVWGRRCEFFSAPRIIAEIEYLVKRHGCRGVYFREDNFTLNRQRTEEFCRGMEHGGLGVQWACESRVDSLCDRETVGMMARSGCRAVYLGVESGSQRMLDRLNKKITVGQVETAVKLCRKNGIRSYCSLLTGVPGETYDDYRQTRELMERIKPFRYLFNVFVGMPDSVLYREMEEKRLYEHKDELGLLYPRGYGTRFRYFYGLEQAKACDYISRDRTGLDWMLEAEMFSRRLKGCLARLKKGG